MISFMTMGTVFAPLVIILTVGGVMAHVSGYHQILGIDDLEGTLSRIFLTSGFAFMGFVMLHKRASSAEFPLFLAASVSVGLVLTGALSVALYRAVFRKDAPLFGNKTSWICTPKTGNSSFKPVETCTPSRTVDNLQQSLMSEPRRCRTGD